MTGLARSPKFVERMADAGAKTGLSWSVTLPVNSGSSSPTRGTVITEPLMTRATTVLFTASTCPGQTKPVACIQLMDMLAVLHALPERQSAAAVTCAYLLKRCNSSQDAASTPTGIAEAAISPSKTKLPMRAWKVLPSRGKSNNVVFVPFRLTVTVVRLGIVVMAAVLVKLTVKLVTGAMGSTAAGMSMACPEQIPPENDCMPCNIPSSFSPAEASLLCLATKGHIKPRYLL